MTTGSGQQSVTGVDSADDSNSYWRIRGKPNILCQRGSPVQCGQQIRITHMTTGRNLHSHHFSSPLSNNQVMTSSKKTNITINSTSSHSQNDTNCSVVIWNNSSCACLDSPRCRYKKLNMSYLFGMPTLLPISLCTQLCCHCKCSFLPVFFAAVVVVIGSECLWGGW